MQSVNRRSFLHHVCLCGIRLILNHEVSGDIMLPGLAKVNF
jgi:hypothetical protein